MASTPSTCEPIMGAMWTGRFVYSGALSRANSYQSARFHVFNEAGLLVAKAFDRVELCCPARGVVAKDEADSHREADGEQDGLRGDEGRDGSRGAHARS